jgi:hypothetical protein
MIEERMDRSHILGERQIHKMMAKGLAYMVS